MADLFKKILQMFVDKITQYEQLRIDADNERQAMSCGSFNPRFLAKIKRSTVDNR